MIDQARLDRFGQQLVDDLAAAYAGAMTNIGRGIGWHEHHHSKPWAGDRLEDNLNPVGRLYHAASTALCTPDSLSQEVGTALGAQAGEARLRAILAEAGFGTIRRAARTPFNLMLEARA